MKTDFRNFLDKKVFDDFALWKASNPRPHLKSVEWLNWCDVTREFEEHVFRDALIQFLKTMKKNGEMHEVANHEGYKVYAVDVWNDVVNAPLDTNLTNKWETISTIIFSSFYEFDFCNFLTPASNDDYERIINLINSGNLPLKYGSKIGDCQISGEGVWITFENWVPYLVFLVYDKETRKYSKPKAMPKVHNHLKKLEIEFLTGDLLISDWFRVADFSKLVESDEYISANSDAGNERLTRYYAETFNFISCFVGDTDPEVFHNLTGKKPNQIVVGVHPTFPNGARKHLTGLKSLYNVCTDLWRVSIIEKDTLKNILAKTHSEDLDQLVLDYVTSNGLKRIQIEPGKYTLYFAPDYRRFAEEIKKENLEFGNIVTPYFALIKNKQ